MNGKLDSATLRATLASAAILTGCSCQTEGRAHPEARIELIARATIPGDARDLSGLSDALAIGGPADALGGFGSAIDWSGEAVRYVTAVDRGPADGATNFPNRLEWFDLRLDTQSSGGLAAILVATTLLVDETGRQLVGDVGAFDLANRARGLRFAPEGVRIGLTGSVYVADEYGPWIVEFEPDGHPRRRLSVPEHFSVRHPGPLREETIRGNSVGRVSNHGFEGLGLSPDGSTLFALLQHPLIQDGGRAGIHARLLEVPVDGGATHEYVVSLDSADLVFNELTAIGARRFLAIELDHVGGAMARTKRIVEIELEGATDVSIVAALPSGTLPDAIRSAHKRLILDLLDPHYGLAGLDFPQKIEGLCFGPDLPDGRRRMIVTSDNDLRADRPSFIWMFAVPDAAISGFVPRAFDAAH